MIAVTLLRLLHGRDLGPQLRALSDVAGAAHTLRWAFGVTATGTGSVCFRCPGDPIDQAAADAAAAGSGAIRNQLSHDADCRTTVRCRRADGVLGTLLAELADVNARLARGGFGALLLYTTVDFTGRYGRGGRLVLVQLTRRGTFYPVVPVGPAGRDRSAELRARGMLTPFVPVERDPARWLAVR